MTSEPLLPGATIGLVGGGQLGRMFVLVARRMGYRTIVIDPDPRAPAAALCDEFIQAPLTDREAARRLAAQADVVTLEWENADIGTVRELATRVPVRPGPHVLEVAQHRLREKEAARRLGLQTADYGPAASLEELRDAVRMLRCPAVLKTATGGYDGKGQYVIRAEEEVEAAWKALGAGDRELILEAWVPFRLEASVLCARSPDGSVASFPVVENLHHRGILDFTLAPARLPERVQRAAIEVGETLVAGLDVVGLLAVELFVDMDDRVLVNEIAPRPHNSGHYTLEACSISQFEQQLRAVCGLPLGDPRLLRPAAMGNLLGEHVGTGAGVAGIAEALRVPMLSLHLYGKHEAREGRKMGHLTALGDSAEAALADVRRARASITESRLSRADAAVP